MSVLSRTRFFKFLTDIELVAVVITIGISLIWPSMLIVAVITATFFWIARWLSAKKRRVRTPGDWGIFMILVMVPVSLWATGYPEITQLQVLRLLSGIALYFAITNWCNSVLRLRMILPAFAMLGLGLALIAAINVQWAIDKLSLIPASLLQEFPALFTDTIHPNVLAGSLVIILPIILAELLFAWRDLTNFERILDLLAFTAMLVVLVLTLSRGAWISLGAVLVVLPILRWRRGWIGLILAIAAVIVLIYLLGLNAILQVLTSSRTIGGIDGRLEIWSRAIYMIQDFPFTGIGMGSFGEVADALYPFFSYAPGTMEHAHNLFLQIAVDLGIPGLIGWLVVLGSVGTISWKLFRFGRENNERLAAGLGAGLLCSQLALIVHGITDAVTWGMVRPAPFVWAIWGLAVAAWSIFVGEKN